ncbi:MAG: sensor histidine kinase [Cyclobacteriaceae bacterium]
MKYLLLILVGLSDSSSLDHHLNRINELQYVNVDSALYHAEQALMIAKSDEPKQRDKVYNLLGRLLVSKGQYDSGLYYHNIALELALKANDQLEIAESYNNIGIVADEQSQHQAAIAQYFNALEVYERLNDLNGQAKVNNNIGIVYKDVGDLIQAVPFYKSAIELYYEMENTLGVASLQNNLATVYNELGRYDSALLMSESSTRYFEENGFEQYKPYPQINSGDALIGLSQYDEALEVLDQAKIGLEQTANQKELADVHRAISESYLGLGVFDSSLNHAKRSYEIALEVNVTVYVQNALEQVYKTFEALGETDSALMYFQRFVDSRETLREESRLRQIRSLEIEYETQKTAKELAEATLVVASQRNQLLLLINAIVIILGIGFFIYLRLRSNQKKRIAETKIAEQKQSIKAVIDAQEEERARIARELHDGVGQSMSAILINQKSIDHDRLSGEIQLKLNKATDLVESTRKEIRTISHQMMPAALIEVGLSEALEQMVSNTFEHSGVESEFDSMLPEGKRYSKDVEVGIYRICQELVQNIFKHANARQVTVSLYERNHQLHMVIEDDGKGFDVKQSSDGIGLINIKTRLELLGGELKLDSTPNDGTLAKLKLPLP